MSPHRRFLTALTAGLTALAGAAAWPAVAAAPRTQVSALTARTAGGTVSLSGWATFSGAVIASGTKSDTNPNATAGPTGADLIGAQLVYRPELADLFLRWQVASACPNCGIPTVGTAPAEVVGDPTVLYGLRSEVDGVPFEIRVQSTGVSAQFGLFLCQTETACTSAATLAGGYGTTGEEVVVDLPLATLAAAVGHPVTEGAKLASPLAYTARAPYNAGVVIPAMYLDSITMAHTATVTVPVKSVQVTVGHVMRIAGLKNGYFSVSFPRSAFPGKGDTTATTRTCLGAACVTERFTVTG